MTAEKKKPTVDGAGSSSRSKGSVFLELKIGVKLFFLNAVNN